MDIKQYIKKTNKRNNHNLKKKTTTRRKSNTNKHTATYKEQVRRETNKCKQKYILSPI